VPVPRSDNAGGWMGQPGSGQSVKESRGPATDRTRPDRHLPWNPAYAGVMGRARGRAQSGHLVRRRLAGLGAAAVAVVLAASVIATAGATPVGGSDRYRAFSRPQRVIIVGYTGSAMEPFVSLDGRYLVFNTSNVPPSVPALQYAVASGAQRFTYRGPVAGANQAGYLSGTPSMDGNGNLYFVSNRNYAPHFATIYAGRFNAGAVVGVHPVPGVTAGAAGLVDFDVDVSPDGNTLYVSVGQFGSGSAPSQADLVVYDRAGNGFVQDPRSAEVLRSVDQAGLLTYAASVSADGRELFFTRADPAGGVPQIYRASRTSVSQPFRTVQRVASISGFAEAPALSADGNTLYFHQRVGDRFVIEDVTRP